MKKPGKVKPLKPILSTKLDHPYVQHMEKLEQLIQGIGVSNDATNKILNFVAEVLFNAQKGNAELISEITTLQKNMGELTSRLIMGDGNEEWVATVESRDRARLIETVKFKKVDNGHYIT